jgi:hypothetical protein
MSEILSLAEQADADHMAFGQFGMRDHKPLERRLNQHAARADAPLLVEIDAEAGNTLMLGWAHRYRAKHPEALVIVHHVGCTRESRRLDNLIFRLLEGLRRGRAFREPLAAGLQARIELLPNWLARAGATGKVVILLAGVDALEGDDPDQAMAWLPQYLPPGVRLIVSAAAGPALEVLRRRPWQPERLMADVPEPPLGAAVEAAAGAENGPLLKLLWAARRGVDESRLARVQPDAAQRLPALGGLVQRHAGQWRLCGAQAQDALRRRLLRDGAEQQAAALELAQLYEHWQDPAALDALPWLLPAAGHWERLAQFLGDETVLTALLDPGRREDLYTAWREWALEEQLLAFYAARVPAWREALSPPRLVSLLLGLSAALEEFLGEQAALEPLLEAARAAADEAGALERAAAQAALGTWLSGRERYSEAEPLLRAALAAREREQGADHAHTRTSRHQLATVAEAQGDLKEAAALYETSLSMREQTLGPRHVELIPHLSNLAAVRKALQDFDGAKPLYQRALAIAERHYGNRHPTTAACLDNLAGLLYAGFDYEQAETLYQRALGVAEAAFGPEHPATAASAHNLATVLDAREQYRAAEQLFRRALAIRQQAYGDEHVDTASTLHNLAGALDSMGAAAQAEPLYRQAVAVWEKLVGAEHPATATSRNNLADLLRGKGEHEEAESLYRRNLQTWSTLMGDEHPHTLMTRAELGALYADQQRLDLAEPLLRQALEQTRRVLGADDMLHIDSAIKLACLLRDSGRRTEAIGLLKVTVAAAEGKISLLSPRLQKLRRHLEALESASEALH